MPLGKTLKALRQKQGLNQKGLSTISGVSQATISRIETGRVRQLRSAALKNLADALSVSVDFLMGDSEFLPPLPTTNLSTPFPVCAKTAFVKLPIRSILLSFTREDASSTSTKPSPICWAIVAKSCWARNGLELLVAPRQNVEARAR